MVPVLFFYQLGLVALIWLCVMLHWAWPSDPTTCPTTSEPTPLPPRRHPGPKPFEGLTTKPHCDAYASSSAPPPQTPSVPPPHIVPTRGRRRKLDTSRHFCPNPDCAYRGWVAWGHLRANGHPNGSPWRQPLCVACRGSFRDPWHDLSWQARFRRTHRARSIGNIKPLFIYTPASASPHPTVPRAGRLTRRSCLGLGDRQQTAASRSEPLWQR